MSHKILLVVFAVLSLQRVVGEEPYLDYVKPLIERETQAAGDVWESTGAGGYLFRFSMDVNNDGNNELFVASSLGINNLNARWTIYKVQSDGEYVRFPESIYLPMTQLVVERTPEGVALLSWSEDQGKAFVGRYQFIGDRIVAKQEEVPQSRIEALEAGKNVEKITPQLEAIHLADYLRDPKSPWMPVNAATLQGNGMGYVVIPKDAERIKQFAQFTPTAAKQMLMQLEKKAPDTAGGSTVEPAVAFEKKTQSPAAPVVSAPTVPESSFFNWLMVVLMALAVVLAGAVGWKFLSRS